MNNYIFREIHNCLLRIVKSEYFVKQNDIFVFSSLRALKYFWKIQIKSESHEDFL